MTATADAACSHVVEDISRRRLAALLLALPFFGVASDLTAAKQRSVRKPAGGAGYLLGRIAQVIAENPEARGVRSILDFYQSAPFEDSQTLRTAGAALLVQAERDIAFMQSPIPDSRIRALLNIEWDLSRYSVRYAEAVASDARQRMACDPIYAEAMTTTETGSGGRRCLLPGGVEVPYWVCVLVVVVIIGSAGLLL